MKQKEEIKKIIEELLNKLSIKFDEVVIKNNEVHSVFVIKTNDSNILIGYKGGNLQAFQHLLYKIVDKKVGREREPFSVDVNDYKEKYIESIKREAIKQGERACFFKHDVELAPMSSYERMLVHSVLSENPRIETNSSGEKEYRHVVISYKG